MSKKISELQDKINELTKENLQLRQANQQLNVSIENLNENTIIQSMNDMKEKYNEIINNTVSLDVFLELKEDHKNILNINNSIYQVNNINQKNLAELFRFLTIYQKELQQTVIVTKEKTTQFDEKYYISKINNTLNSLQNRLELITELTDQCQYWYD